MMGRDWEAVTQQLFGLFDDRDRERWASLPSHERAALAANVRRIVVADAQADADVDAAPPADSKTEEDGEQIVGDGCLVVAGGHYTNEDGHERVYARIHCAGLEAVAEGDTLADAAASARALLPRWGRQPSGQHLIRWRGRTVVIGPDSGGGYVATATGQAGTLRIVGSASPAESAHRIMAWLRP